MAMFLRRIKKNLVEATTKSAWQVFEDKGNGGTGPMEVGGATTRRASEEHVRRRYPLSLPLCMLATQANPNMATLSFFRDSNLDAVISCKNQDYDLVHELALASLGFSYLQNLPFKSRGPNCGLVSIRPTFQRQAAVLRKVDVSGR